MLFLLKKIKFKIKQGICSFWNVVSIFLGGGGGIYCVEKQIVTAVCKDGSAFVFRARKSRDIFKSKSV